MCSLVYNLAGQFVLSMTDGYVPVGWEVRRHGKWSLAAHPKLPVLEMLASDGARLGWLIGYPIHPKHGLLSSTISAPNELTAPGVVAGAERSIYKLGGRFAAIYLVGEHPRVHLDPCGSLGVVFCAAQRIVASSTNLISYSARTGDNQPLIRALGLPGKDAYFPFGLTPRCGIERLLPNHILDLTTWETSRHWPRPGELSLRREPGGAVAEMASILERQIEALTRTGPMYMGLTAGVHTRMMLACARAHLDRIAFFTIPFPDSLGRIDSTVARWLTRRFGLNSAPMRWREPTQEELDEWLYRTGACVGGRVLRTARTLRLLNPSRGILTGTLGSPGHES